MTFEKKRILITGSSRGIGFASAKHLLSLGAHVVVNGRSTASTNEAIAALDNHNSAIPVSGDVGTEAGCRHLVDTAVEQLGGLDVLINSAGIGESGRIEECSEDMWDRTLDINLKGTFFCIKAALGALRASTGNVVNIASDAGLIGENGLSVYCASKGGVVNMTRAIALELAPAVRVNCVCPGYVDTDMVRRDGIERADDPAAAEQALVNYAPLQRIATPQEIAEAVAYVASDAARFMTGAALQIDGGSTAGHAA